MGWGDGTSRKMSSSERRKAAARAVKRYGIDPLTGVIVNSKKAGRIKAAYRTRIKKGLCPGCGKAMRKEGMVHTQCAMDICASEFVSNKVVQDRHNLYTEDGRNKNNIRWDEPGFKFGD